MAQKSCGEHYAACSIDRHDRLCGGSVLRTDYEGYTGLLRINVGTVR